MAISLLEFLNLSNIDDIVVVQDNAKSPRDAVSFRKRPRRRQSQTGCRWESIINVPPLVSQAAAMMSMSSPFESMHPKKLMPSKRGSVPGYTKSPPMRTASLPLRMPVRQESLRVRPIRQESDRKIASTLDLVE